MLNILIPLFMVGISFMQQDFIQNIFFVYGVIALWCISLLFEPKRKFVSVELSMFLLWALACIFLNAEMVSSSSIVFKYLNIYLMSEGFIYLFCAVIFIKIFVEHIKNIKLFYFVLPICFVPWLLQNSVSPINWCSPGTIHIAPWSILNSRFTLLFSFIISASVYLFIKKRYKIIIPVSGLMFLIAILKWKMVCLKFSCRPVIWIDMLHKIKEHPFIGTGFNRSLIAPDMMWVDYQKYGYVLKHNDYGALAMNLGIIPVILMGIFTMRIYSKIYTKKIAIPFLAFCILCFFQSTMYSVYHGVIICSVLAIAIIKRGA